MSFWGDRKQKQNRKKFMDGYGWACCQVLYRQIPISAIEQQIEVSSYFGDNDRFDKGVAAAITKLIALGVSTE